MNRLLINSSEICSSGDKYLMCPTCDETQGCQYWHLSEICLFSKLSVMFDHSGTVFYSIFISFWGKNNSLKNWKSKNWISLLTRNSGSISRVLETFECIPGTQVGCYRFWRRRGKANFYRKNFSSILSKKFRINECF
jgi:hypothetical protein